jgi:hypothetical protein
LEIAGVPALVLLLGGADALVGRSPLDLVSVEQFAAASRSPPLVLTRPSGAVTRAGASIGNEQSVVPLVTKIFPATGVSARRNPRQSQIPDLLPSFRPRALGAVTSAGAKDAVGELSFIRVYFVNHRNSFAL